MNTDEAGPHFQYPENLFGRFSRQEKRISNIDTNALCGVPDTLACG
jgi:hypothetical protein